MTREPEMNSAPQNENGANGPLFRQICPPAEGLSSITATEAKDLRAAMAAAIPAGPAPTMTTSKALMT
jgi:hypothetical protein